MSRLAQFLTVTIVVMFLLACSFITQPIQDTENLAKTAQAVGSAIPVETLEAFGTSMPNLENVFNPQGAPVQEWKGIPVMPQATAGQEFPEQNTYSFKVNTTIKEVQDFYTEKLTTLGWKKPFDIPAEGDAAIMVFQKENNSLTITITSWEEYFVVLLSLQ